MRILALDAALGPCSAALVTDEIVTAERRESGGRGQAALLPVMVHAVLEEAGVTAADLDAVAVTVGPGSFTGLRAGLALAHGIGLAAGKPVVGVTVAEALADSLPWLRDRALWTAIDSRRGRVFIEAGGEWAAYALDALPDPDRPVALTGNGAAEVACALAARGYDVMLTDARIPIPRHVALVAARRLRGELPALAAQPLYIDQPEARLPAGGLRPPPAAGLT
jgi:tRNA threonylcarbamoyl adenosine modification protein YeaZ